MTIQELKELASHVVNGTSPENYSLDSVKEAFQDGLQEYAGSINKFLKNRYDLYDIVIEQVEKKSPKKVIDRIGIFAEVKVVPQGQKALFKRSLGKKRARLFLTQVALSGIYETFRLDKETFEVGAHAVGGAVLIDFERMLDNADILTELVDLFTESMNDAVYVEIHKALRAAVDTNPSAETNVVIDNAFNGTNMVKLLNVARAYSPSRSAVIYATPEFIGAMGPDAIVPAIPNGGQGVYHPQDIDRIHNFGTINLFRGAPIIEIEQSFIDENNKKTWIDPQIAYIFPTGTDNRPVKVVIEGQPQIYDYVNRDRSMEINGYTKVGVAIQTYNDWCIYKNSGVPQTYENPYKGLD